MFLAASALFLTSCLWGSQVQSQQTTPDWSQHYRDSTISFGRVLVDSAGRKVYAVVGTGIITATDERHGYIVTARHVFDDPSLNWHPSELQVRFSWQQHESVEDELGVTLTLIQSGRQLWKSLSDGTDIAAIALPQNFGNHPLQAVGLQDYAAADDIYDGAPVFIYGFPGFVGNQRLVRAITRSGVVAWTDPDDPEHRPFLVDANIFPGNSGGPVFKVPSGLSRTGTFVVGTSVKFMGIVSQTAVQQFDVKPTAPGEAVTAGEAVQVVGLGALGIIVPAAKVSELIRSM